MNMSSILSEDFEYIRKNYDFSFLNGKSVLITGASGLLGKQLCLYLLYLNEKNNANIKVLALVRNLEKAENVFADEFKNPNITFIKGDVLDTKNLESALADKNIDFVIHGASITSSKDFINHAVETIDTAVNGTLNLLRFAKSKNAEGFVYLSSMEAFGITDGMGDVREKDLGYIDISSPRSSYMESKRMCENLCACFASEYNLNVKTCRLTQTFGPGISYSDTRVAAYFARSVIENTDIVLKTKGATKRPVLYTRDAVNAILTVLKSGEKGESYTAANPETFVTIKETAEMVADKIASGKIKVAFDITNPSEYAPNLNLNLNVDKLCALGWKPSVGLEEAYRRMIEEMRQLKDLQEAKIKIVFVMLSKNDIAEQIFSDVILDKDCDILPFYRTPLGTFLVGLKSPMAKFFKKIHLYGSVSKLKLCYKLGKYKHLNQDTTYIFVYVGDAARKIPPEIFKRQSKKVKTVILLMDSCHASSPTAAKLMPILKSKIWDGIYTFDKYDAKEFGWKDIGLCYFSTSRLPKPQLHEEIKSDAFFVGALKGEREKTILSLFESLLAHGANPDFVIFCMDKKQFKGKTHADKITYVTKRIEYQDVLKKTMGTNCIMEILQKNQQAQSIRYFEALYYNKKLLTNNPHIKELPYFDPRYMKYFEKIEDVDFDWVKKRETVDYGYKNDFSALNLAKQIKNDFC